MTTGLVTIRFHLGGSVVADLTGSLVDRHWTHVPSLGDYVVLIEGELMVERVVWSDDATYGGPTVDVYLRRDPA